MKRFSVEQELAEILLGAVLLITSFLASLFMVVGILEKDVALSLLLYSMALSGVVIGLHGVLGWARRER